MRGPYDVVPLRRNEEDPRIYERAGNAERYQHADDAKRAMKRWTEVTGVVPAAFDSNGNEVGIALLDNEERGRIKVDDLGGLL